MYQMMPKSMMSWRHGDELRSVCEKRSRRDKRARADDLSADGATTPQASIHEQVKACAVYLLVHEREPRFKIGISNDPIRRARMLPEAPHLQWDACLKATFPSRERANEIEGALHKMLSVFRIHVHGVDGERWDGGSEWFELRGLSHAVNLLSHMPLEEDTNELVTVRTISGESYLGMNPRPGFHQRREMRHFEAAHANIRHMHEVVRVMRRINDVLTVVRHVPANVDDPQGCQTSDEAEVQEGLPHFPGSQTGESSNELVYIYGLGSCWESDLLAERFKLSDSDFWLFNTGMARAFNRQRTWMTRIAFDTHLKSTLVLTMQDRQVIRGLPGGARMLVLWDDLWAD